MTPTPQAVTSTRSLPMPAPSLYATDAHRLQRAMMEARALATRAIRNGKFPKMAMARQALKVADACARALDNAEPTAAEAYLHMDGAA